MAAEIPNYPKIYPGECFICMESDGIPEALRLGEWDPTQRIGTSFAFSCGHTIHEECWYDWLASLRSIDGVIPSCGRCRCPIDMELIPQESLRRRVRREYSAAYTRGKAELSTLSSCLVLITGCICVWRDWDWKSERENKFLLHLGTIDIDLRIYGREEPQYISRLGKPFPDPNCLIHAWPTYYGEVKMSDWEMICFPQTVGSNGVPNLQPYLTNSILVDAIGQGQYVYYSTPFFLIIRIMAFYLAYRAVRNLGEHRAIRHLAGGLAATGAVLDYYCPSVIKKGWEKLKDISYILINSI